MYIKTNLPGIQFYTGNFLDGSYQGKNGYNLLKNFGLCLEPQFYPDSPNHAHFPSTILKKGTEYNKCIIYGLTI
jgi:aldose 1-epimerase